MSTELTIENLDEQAARTFNVLAGWWVLANGNPYVGPLQSREDADIRLQRLTRGKPASNPDAG